MLCQGALGRCPRHAGRSAASSCSSTDAGVAAARDQAEGRAGLSMPRSCASAAASQQAKPTLLQGARLRSPPRPAASPRRCAGGSRSRPPGSRTAPPPPGTWPRSAALSASAQRTQREGASAQRLVQRSGLPIGQVCGLAAARPPHPPGCMHAMQLHKAPRQRVAWPRSAMWSMTAQHVRRRLARHCQQISNKTKPHR